MYVTDREWCDFMSYYPGLKPFIKRVYRDEKYIQQMARYLKEAVEELHELTIKLGGKP